jgi:hypothetical protein
MFTYGLDQFIELYLWEREREIRTLLPANRIQTERHRWSALWTASHRILDCVGTLFVRLSRAPHGRA